MRQEKCRKGSVNFSQENGASSDVLQVKTELRKTIQLRREAQGLGSVEIDDEEETKSVEVKRLFCMIHFCSFPWLHLQYQHTNATVLDH